MASSHLIYFGTYTRSTSRGIYAARLDSTTGALSEPTVAAETAGPTWLTFSPDKSRLYAVHPSKAQVIGYAIDSSGALMPLPPGPGAGEKAGGPCHLAVDATNNVLVAANYGEGFVAALPIRSDGALGAPNIEQHHGHGPNPKRQEKPHVHSVTFSPDNRHVIVCDLGLDEVMTYEVDLKAAKLTKVATVKTAPGAGPRHFKFGATGRHGYVLTEMGATIITYDFDPESGTLNEKQTVSMLPPDFSGERWAAEVRVHPNGKFLYGSNRTHDSIAVFAIDETAGTLSLIEIVRSGGKTPRNFALSPDGKWLVCAHQDSDNVTVFGVDGQTGRLRKTSHTAVVPMAVCVAFRD